MSNILCMVYWFLLMNIVYVGGKVRFYAVKLKCCHSKMFGDFGDGVYSQHV